MKCNECDYAADYIDDSDVDKKQCDITDEVHEAGFECNCEVQRGMYDKRNKIIMEYNSIKEQTTLSSTCIICGDTVDNEYGATKVCCACKEAIEFVRNNINSLDSIVSCYEHGLEEENPVKPAEG
jgi:hypothetical protein